MRLVMSCPSNNELMPYSGSSTVSSVDFALMAAELTRRWDGTYSGSLGIPNKRKSSNRRNVQPSLEVRSRPIAFHMGEDSGRW